MGRLSAHIDQLTPLQRAVFALKEMQAKLDAADRARAEPIAIIGLGCRFPGGSDSPEAFWTLLRDGVDAIREIPGERWDVDSFYDPDPSTPGKMNTRWGGFLDRVDGFDTDFFGISPRETLRMDPQHRLVLEVAWEALEHAGLPPFRLAGSRTGVFVGILGNDYAQMQALDAEALDAYCGTGSAHSIAANRLSYLLDFRGPSVALDTACSSSLVTVHLACQSLRRGESDLALAGGVNLILGPELTIALSQARMLSPEGRCKTFDAGANGYVRSEGCGMVVLKRLRDAQADGDTILALIRGTAINQDGRSNGLTAPNGPAQQDVLRAALADAGVDPGRIGYVEAHGTGTPLGDPIEVQALLAVLGPGRDADHPLVVGSVKTNIGHLEGAAGVAGLIKTVLALSHEIIPPHLHVKEVNPLLAPEGPSAPVLIPSAPLPWPRGAEPRYAGLSSFGFGGTNAHAVLEEAPTVSAAHNPVDRPRHMVTLSARTEPALTEVVGRLQAHLVENPSAALADLAYSANTGRSHFAHRLAVVTETVDDLRDQLQAHASGKESAAIRVGQALSKGRPPVAFLFTGQGSQYVGMGRALFDTQPTFRAALTRCDDLLRPHLERPLLSVLYPEPGATSPLDQTGYTQPALFAIEYALAEMWRSWGIEPSAVLGHSVGEYVAACVAGALSLEDGLKLIAARGRLMQELPRGGMMAAVFAPESKVASVLRPYGDRVAIAALNGPENVVISGAADAVRTILANLSAEGVKAQALATSHAFHSPLMEPMLDALERVAASVSFAPPTVELIANLTGLPADATTLADPGYWRQHARRPVRFAAGMQTLAERGYELFLEIGPNPTLLGMGRRCLPESQALWLPSLRRQRDDWQSLLESLSALYVRGAGVDWSGFDRDYDRRLVALPTYPFQRQKYWFGGARSPSQPAEPTPRVEDGKPSHPLLGGRLRVPIADRLFESRLSAERPAILADYQFHGKAVLPASALLEMALAGASGLGEGPWALEEVSFGEPLVLDGSAARTVQTVVTADGAVTGTFRIVSPIAGAPDDETSWTTHASGRVRAVPATEAGRNGHLTRLAEERARFTEPPSDRARHQQALRESGFEIGPAFDWLDQSWLRENAGLGSVRAPLDTDQAESFGFHPGLIESGCQVLTALLQEGQSSHLPFVPVSVGRLRMLHRSTSRSWALVSVRSVDDEGGVGDFRLFDDDGHLLAEVEGLRLIRAPRAWQRIAEGPVPDWLYKLEWKPRPLSAATVRDDREGPGRWLIVADRDGVGAALASRLSARNEHCHVVRPGADAEELQRRLVEFLAEDRLPYRGVIHASILDAGGPETDPDLDTARELGCGLTLDLVHALTESARARPPRLWLITRGTQAVGPRPGPIASAQAPVWGLARVIGVEHSELACVRIDLDPARNHDQNEALFQEIWAGDREDQVALRAEGRYVARLTRLSEAPSPGLTLRGDATYLMTGGLGGLGLKFARWLVDRGARHLVLVGRSGASEEAHPVLEELEALGATVVVARADIARREEVEGLLAHIDATMPPLRGVIHAAGVLDDGVLRQQTRDRFARVMAAKVAGGWNLHALTRERELDLFVLFSSAASLLGSPGQGNYAAANAFLDVLAHQRRSEGLPALTVNWGSWSEVGMAAALDGAEGKRWSASGMGRIDPARGVEMMERLLGSDETQVGVLPIDWPKFFARIPVGAEPAWLDELTSQGRPRAVEALVPSDLVRRLQAAAPGDRHDLLLSDVRCQAARVLGLDASHPPDPRRPLNELGLDSLMAVELCTSLSRSVGKHLPATLLFDYPTLEALTEHLARDVLDLETGEEPESTESADDAIRAQALAEVEGLSEEEMDSLVSREIAKLTQ